MLRSPACAVPGSHQVRLQLREGHDSRIDDGLESGSTEVKPSDESVQPVHLRKPLSVPNDVDRSGVAAASEDHEAAAA